MTAKNKTRLQVAVPVVMWVLTVIGFVWWAADERQIVIGNVNTNAADIAQLKTSAEETQDDIDLLRKAIGNLTTSNGRIETHLEYLRKEYDKQRGN